MKDTIVVSACLLGLNCRYDGGNNYCPKVASLSKKYRIIPVCPEVMGGLTIPRHPSEIRGGKVINKIGDDVSLNYQEGAKKALAMALNACAKFAVLKARSPACGSGGIYDGTFTHTLILKDGIAAECFKREGIKVITEEEL